jgi:hypothetical protein
MAVFECPLCSAPLQVEDASAGRAVPSAGEIHRCAGAKPLIATGDRLAPRTAEAVRLIVAQLGCSDDEALTRLRERAKFLQYRVHDYALLVIDGIVRFDPPGR